MTHHFSMPLSLFSSPPPWGRGTGLARWWGHEVLKGPNTLAELLVAVTARRGTPARHRFPSLKFPASPFESASRQRADA